MSKMVDAGVLIEKVTGAGMKYTPPVASPFWTQFRKCKEEIKLHYLRGRREKKKRR